MVSTITAQENQVMEYWHQGGKWEWVVWEKPFQDGSYSSYLYANQIDKKLPISSQGMAYIIQSYISFSISISYRRFMKKHYLTPNLRTSNILPVQSIQRKERQEIENTLRKSLSTKITFMLAQ